MIEKELLNAYADRASSAFATEGFSPAYQAYFRVVLALQTSVPALFLFNLATNAKSDVQKNIYETALREFLGA